MKVMIPDNNRSVRFGEAEEPDPTSKQVIVAVEAYSVNRGETFLLDVPAKGWRPGKDIAGTVIIPAADGNGPVMGTRIVAHISDSEWAERVAVNAASLVVLPDDIFSEIAAALPLAGRTALCLWRRAGNRSDVGC